MNIAYLEKRDAARNQFRFYGIKVAPTLFGDWVLIREWGRIGRPGTVREDSFDLEEPARQAGLRLQRRKERRGYQALLMQAPAGALAPPAPVPTGNAAVGFRAPRSSGHL